MSAKGQRRWDGPEDGRSTVYGKQIQILQQVHHHIHVAWLASLLQSTFQVTPQPATNNFLLVQNTALRLYKVPKESQLLVRLGGAWHTPNPNDLPLPTPNRSRVSTTLRTLAAKVPRT